MFPSITQIFNGLILGLNLLRRRPLEDHLSNILIKPIGLWHAIYVTSIIQIIAKLTILKAMVLEELSYRVIISTIPITFTELFVFSFFIYFLLNLINKNSRYFIFIIPFLWLISLQNLLLLITIILLMIFPSLTLLISLLAIIFSFQILITQFLHARNSLDTTILICIFIVIGNILVGLFVGLIDQTIYNIFNT